MYAGHGLNFRREVVRRADRTFETKSFFVWNTAKPPSSCGRPSGFAFPPYDVGLGRTLSGVVEPECKLNAPIRLQKNTPAHVRFQPFFRAMEPHGQHGSAIKVSTGFCPPMSDT